MKKKVCVFTTHPSKDLRILNRQCFSLARNSWDVTLIATAATYLNTDSKVGESMERGVRIIGVPHWRNRWGKFKTLYKITKIAEKENADIYHFHDPLLIIPALQLMKKTKKPFIYDIHEYYDMQLVYRLPNIWPLRQIAGAMVRLFEVWLGKRIHNISVVCEEHVERYRRVGCKVVHTPNYASLEDFHPACISEEEWNKRMKTIIYTGSIAPARGSMLIPEIAKRVKEVIPDAQFLVTRRFHKGAHEQAFLEILKKPGFENVITFLPNMSGKELPKYVRKAGIALSVDPENVICAITSPPTKLFEYMSQACSIIASRLPNTIEYVEQVGCGILVKPDDPQSYADAIIYLIQNPAIMQEMGRKGQEAYRKKYNWSIIEKRLTDFYDSIFHD